MTKIFEGNIWIHKDGRAAHVSVYLDDTNKLFVEYPWSKKPRFYLVHDTVDSLKTQVMNVFSQQLGNLPILEKNGTPLQQWLILVRKSNEME